MAVFPKDNLKLHIVVLVHLEFTIRVLSISNGVSIADGQTQNGMPRPARIRQFFGKLV